METMEVKNKTICCGITKAARQLGVSYCHLWKVLNGKYSSPSLVMKIIRICPSLTKTDVCKIDCYKIARQYSCDYIWDKIQNRYTKRKH